MKFRVGQLFVRDIGSSENTYMVCGIIKTDKPLATETTHIFTADMVNVLESQNVHCYSRGNGFDGIMRSPIWRVKR